MPGNPSAAFYRWSLVRVVFVASGLFLAWLFSPWGSQTMRATPSLEWLHYLLPWPVFAVAFLAYAALIAYGRIQFVVIGESLGLALYLLELIALIATARGHTLDGHPYTVNGWAVIAFVLAVVLHAAALRLAVFQREML